MTNGVTLQEAGSVATGCNTVTFWLPNLPGSVNQIYEPGHSIYSARPEWKIKDEWALWSTRMKPYILPLPFAVAPMSIIRMDRCFYYPWFYKNGNWRKADTPNMDKLLFDTVSSKIGINDLRFKKGMMDSENAESGKVHVTLTEILESEWNTPGVS